jgi:hypothetical protein
MFHGMDDGDTSLEEGLLVQTHATIAHTEQPHRTTLRAAAKPFLASATIRPSKVGGNTAASKERIANLQRNKPIAPGQPPPQYRVKDRFVSLPDESSYQPRLSDEFIRPEDGEVPSIFQDFDAAQGSRGRITSYCVAETIDRKLLMELLKRDSVLSIEIFPEVVYARCERPNNDGVRTRSDVFFFDYGTVCFKLAAPACMPGSLAHCFLSGGHLGHDLAGGAAVRGEGQGGVLRRSVGRCGD